MADTIQFADALVAVRPFASQTEAEAGTIQTKAMNPLLTAQAIAELTPLPPGSSIRDQLKTLGGVNRLPKSALWGADVALNKRGVGNVTEAGYKGTYMTAPLKGDFWVMSGAASPAEGDDSDLLPGDWVIAVKDAANTSDYSDTAEWWIMRFRSQLFGGSDNNTQWDATGHQTMEGDARPWRDELGDALSLLSTGPGVSVNIPEASIDFIHTAEITDYIIKGVQFNHDRDILSDIHPHIHWWQSESSTPNWVLYYRWQKTGSAKVTSWTALKLGTNAFTYGIGTIHQITSCDAITSPTGSDISDICQFKVCRDHSNAAGKWTGDDAYTATVSLLSFDIHIQMNSLGSTDEYTK
jgi:hypothetical protein